MNTQEATTTEQNIPPVTRSAEIFKILTPHDVVYCNLVHVSEGVMVRRVPITETLRNDYDRLCEWLHIAGMLDNDRYVVVKSPDRYDYTFIDPDTDVEVFSLIQAV